jgi:hypothetical protein
VPEAVPLSATVCVIGGGFHPVVAFGSIWRGLWSGAQCLCQVNECSSGVHASHASYSIANWPHNTRKERRAIDLAVSVLGAAVLHADHELTIIMFCIHR